MSRQTSSPLADILCLAVMLVFVLGLAALGVRMWYVQVEYAAEFGRSGERQSVRRLRTVGPRGRILDRRGRVLADNRRSASIVCETGVWSRRTRSATVAAILGAVTNAAAATGLAVPFGENAVRRHLEGSASLPLVVWENVDDAALARFCEHLVELPGFEVAEGVERTYPCGRLAAHVLGFVGRDRRRDDAAGGIYDFREAEPVGRSGLERYYDGFLRGIPGEDELVVTAQCFTRSRRTVVAADCGSDLHLTLDVDIQRAAEATLAGECGACAVIDPRDGSVLALASAPTFEPSRCIPHLPVAYYAFMNEPPLKPGMNRAIAESYAPGSTFKPITALAALAVGWPADRTYECTGAFHLGSMHLGCSRRWGHGPLDLRGALRYSCNPFFCELGCDVGTNALCSAARVFGLGAVTGIDLPGETAGIVPSAGYKAAMYRERWFPGDVAQMSIGQGLLLVTPLQMACVAGAIGTGAVVRPHLKADMPTRRRQLPFSAEALAVVRDGMFQVVNAPDGTGRLAGGELPVRICGKTGTAEVGPREARRKNTWFIAYGPAEAPRVAVAMVVENGVSGGGTTAPKVNSVLREAFRAL